MCNELTSICIETASIETTLYRNDREPLEQRVVRPSVSPWASVVVLVKKPDGSDRFCVDCRTSNDVTKKDSYPLPRFQRLMDTYYEG